MKISGTEAKWFLPKTPMRMGGPRRLLDQAVRDQPVVELLSDMTPPLSRFHRPKRPEPSGGDIKLGQQGLSSRFGVETACQPAQQAAFLDFLQSNHGAITPSALSYIILPFGRQGGGQRGELDES